MYDLASGSSCKQREDFTASIIVSRVSLHSLELPLHDPDSEGGNEENQGRILSCSCEFTSFVSLSLLMLI